MEILDSNKSFQPVASGLVLCYSDMNNAGKTQRSLASDPYSSIKKNPNKPRRASIQQQEQKGETMKPKNLVYFILALALLLSTSQAMAFIPSDTAVTYPWQKSVIDAEKPGVRNLSTAFVGNYQVPMLSWGETDKDIIYYAFRMPGGDGECGPDLAWRCNSATATNLVDGTLSNLATQTFINSHVIRWVYQSGTNLRGRTIEQKDDMSFLTASEVDLVDLNKFGGILVGAPSLISDGLRFRMAFTARESGGGDFPLYQVVYMYYKGAANNSCKDGSLYQCDVIDFSFGPNSFGPVSLQVVGGSVGITYYKSGMPSAIRYAYPWTSTSIFRPANCGPGLNTWRCIDIDAPNTGELGWIAKLAYGSSSTAAGILYSYKPIDKDMLVSAIYVGSGGNCGQDGLTATIPPSPVYRWSCTGMDAFIYDITATTYSIDFDPEDFPVIAWNNRIAGDTRQRLYLAYQAARAGTGGGWIMKLIDGNDWSTTGAQAALSISQDGLGFIGYMQPSYRACGEWYCLLDNSPNLKVALQKYPIYLPMMKR